MTKNEFITKLREAVLYFAPYVSTKDANGW